MLGWVRRVRVLDLTIWPPFLNAERSGRLMRFLRQLMNKMYKRIQCMCTPGSLLLLASSAVWPFNVAAFLSRREARRPAEPEPVCARRGFYMATRMRRTLHYGIASIKHGAGCLAHKGGFCCRDGERALICRITLSIRSLSLRSPPRVLQKS